MRVERRSPCKVNFTLNILGRRADGFHELETLLYPIRYFDTLSVENAGHELKLTCSDPTLATDQTNLVYRAAAAFLKAQNISDGLSIHLEKRIPMAAGLGGGSGNAAATLLALNELFATNLPFSTLAAIGAELGSDVPFFLQRNPAIGLGRGERIEPLKPFTALRGMYILLIHPGFGISTPWAYKSLGSFPAALNGTPGRAAALARTLSEPLDPSHGPHLTEAAKTGFYNSLEAPALHKYPVLKLYQEFFLTESAEVALMSGSGSTTFAIFKDEASAASALEKFQDPFGRPGWSAIVPLAE
jgi:4-diphosphocytidyl-2-C-methyl-D-erythritol kinase